MNKPYSDLPHEPCCQLRWKAMFVDSAPNPDVPASNDQIYWCAESLTCIGPDNGVASPRDCGPGRSCYDKLI